MREQLAAASKQAIDDEVDENGAEEEEKEENEEPEPQDETKVLPCCGVATVFTSGFENVRGVEPVRAGRRVVLASWFTTEKQHDRSAEYELQSHAEKLQLQQTKPHSLTGDSTAPAELSPAHEEL